MERSNKGLQGQYAGFVSRAIAFIVDALIVVGIIALVNGVAALTLDLFFGVKVGACPPIGWGDLLSPVLLCHAADWLRIVLTIVVTPGYFALFWTLGGQTPGQYALGLRVVRLDGRRMTVWRSLVRWLGYSVSFLALGLGYLWVLWDDRRQGFADKMARTVVVYGWEARQNEFLLDRVWQRLRRIGRQTSAQTPAISSPLTSQSTRLELVQAIFPTMARVRSAMNILQNAIRSDKFRLVTSVVVVKDESGALGFVGSSDLATGDQSSESDAILASDSRLSRVDAKLLTEDVPNSSFVLWLVVEDRYLTALLTTLSQARVAAQVFDLDVPAHEPVSVEPIGSDDEQREGILQPPLQEGANAADSQLAVTLSSVLTDHKV